MCVWSKSEGPGSTRPNSPERLVSLILEFPKIPDVKTEKGFGL